MCVCSLLFAFAWLDQRNQQIKVVVWLDRHVTSSSGQRQRFLRGFSQWPERAKRASRSFFYVDQVKKKKTKKKKIDLVFSFVFNSFFFRWLAKTSIGKSFASSAISSSFYFYILYFKRANRQRLFMLLDVVILFSFFHRIPVASIVRWRHYGVMSTYPVTRACRLGLLTFVCKTNCRQRDRLSDT